MNTVVKTLKQKLAILADAAKYDASCASSGSTRPTPIKKGLGATAGMGICHSFTPDGRCVSLLKILLTNFCILDCAYCVNRSSSNVERARFTTDEVVYLTLEFYRRNYIEGLFLSSGIIRSADNTMEEIVKVARDLRKIHHFGGYIHLKTIPDASPELVREAGLYADRLSINVELPTSKSISRFAPQKNIMTIKRAMANVKVEIESSKDATWQSKRTKHFAPAGQSTQMIIGADNANDATILQSSAELYSGYRLKRVYYSAFSPIPDASNLLPVRKPLLLREHRLYQADWLYRFYGFAMEELTAKTNDGMLELDFDPKLAWALNNRHLFPIDINKADKEMLLRVPGLGVRNVKRILIARRFKRLDFEDLKTFHIGLNKIKPFIVAERWTPKNLLDNADLAERFRNRSKQLELFSS